MKSTVKDSIRMKLSSFLEKSKENKIGMYSRREDGGNEENWML